MDDTVSTGIQAKITLVKWSYRYNIAICKQRWPIKDIDGNLLSPTSSIKEDCLTLRRRHPEVVRNLTFVTDVSVAWNRSGLDRPVQEDCYSCEEKGSMVVNVNLAELYSTFHANCFSTMTLMIYPVFFIYFCIWTMVLTNIIRTLNSNNLPINRTNKKSWYQHGCLYLKGKSYSQKEKGVSKKLIFLDFEMNKNQIRAIVKEGKKVKETIWPFSDPHWPQNHINVN